MVLYNEFRQEKGNRENEANHENDFSFMLQNRVVSWSSSEQSAYDQIKTEYLTYTAFKNIIISRSGSYISQYSHFYYYMKAR